MFDLGGKVKCKSRELLMHCLYYSDGMIGAVQEVGIPKSNVGRAGQRQLSYVLQHNIRRRREKASAIDRGNRTVPAMVKTASGGFNVTNQPKSVVMLKLCILIE